jgi:pimeloyl-ACP methyl ester carboxylesterase
VGAAASRHARRVPWSNQAVTAGIVGCLQRPEALLIDGAGHLPNLEAETEFNDALRAFSRAHAPGSAARPGWERDRQ